MPRPPATGGEVPRHQAQGLCVVGPSGEVLQGELGPVVVAVDRKSINDNRDFWGMLAIAWLVVAGGTTAREPVEP